MICDYMVTYQASDNRWNVYPSRSGRISKSTSDLSEGRTL